LVGGWVERINEAIAPANAAIVVAQPKLEAIWASVHDQASSRAAAAQARDLLRVQRSQIVGAQSALAAVPSAPPEGAHLPGIDVTMVLRDAQTLVAQLLAYNDTMIKLCDAIESGDADAVRAATPAVVRGGLLIVEGQATVYRGRERLMPADEPAHQMIGVTVALYDAMSVAMRASFRATLDHQPEQAAADERRGLSDLADRLGVDMRVGRRNLVRVRNELLGGPLAHMPGGDAARIIAKVRMLADGEEKIFAVGDELEAWTRTEGQQNEVVRKPLGQSEMLHRLYEMEQRLISIQNEAAAVLAGTH
jgi:hypothetical protein